MAGLVLEGGAFRGAYTDGVLDGLLDNNIMFDYIIGVSAGAANGYSYVSRQRGRNIEILKKYVNDKRYMSLKNYLKQKSLFGIDFIYDEIPNKLIPYDFNALKEYKGRIISTLTDAREGTVRYYDQSYIDKKFKMLRATCALPIIFPPIEFDNNLYYDGGLVDPIPIKKSIEDNNKKNLIVLTREEGYLKTPPNLKNKLGSFMVGRKFKAISHLINNRHIAYNDTLKFIKNLETNNDAVILRPKKEVNVSRLEKNKDKLVALYNQGVDDVNENIDKIKELF